MGGGNGCKAAMKRERQGSSGKDASGAKKANSQLKVNQQALSLVCQQCFTSFLCTASEKVLREHIEQKHSATASSSITQFFPNYTVPSPSNNKK